MCVHLVIHNNYDKRRIKTIYVVVVAVKKLYTKTLKKT